MFGCFNGCLSEELELPYHLNFVFQLISFLELQEKWSLQIYPVLIQSSSIRGLSHIDAPLMLSCGNYNELNN